MIRDDGEGIRPNEDREAALRYIATHIGRSQKRNLSARERHEQVVAGKYGIGLLGFWSIGHRMEIRSRVHAGTNWLLRLIEDEASAEIVAGPPAIDQPDTLTEIVISELHPTASRALAAQRLAEFLGAELRGPILASCVAVELRDFDARGQLVERIAVVPRRFDGTRLALPAHLAVRGYPPIGVEPYHAGSGGAVELTCAGTVVADRIADLGGLGLDHSPWNDPALTGTLEFAALSIPPGTRRGVIPDAAADAFVAAVSALAPQVQAALAQLAVQRHVASERQLMIELRRALRGLRDRLPYLGMPAQLPGRGASGVDRGADPLGMQLASARADRVDAGTAPEDADNIHDEGDPGSAGEDIPPPTLLPPGPAHHVRISPDPVRLWQGGRKRVRAIVFDVHGQRIAAHTSWSASSRHLTIDGDGPSRTIGLVEVANVSALSLTVVADANGGACSATAEIAIVDGPPAGGVGPGIPEPILVDEAGQSWRSRMSADGWHVNIGHSDYGALAADARARLRYLVALFAKDLTVSITHRANEGVLDQMIDVIALAERNLLRPR